MKLPNTKAALEIHDKALARFQEIALSMAGKVLSDELAALIEDENNVRRAFHKDTADVNPLDKCMMVDLGWLRRMVAKEDQA
jgi:hypothetical protein